MSRRCLLLLIVCAPAFAAQPWTPTDLWAWREISEVRIHPEGTAVLWVETFHDPQTDAAYSNLWKISPGDPEPRRLTDGKWRDGSHRWSPDGRHVAFLSDRSGTPQIWLRGMIDGRSRQETRVESPPLAFSWAPDGSALAYIARDGLFVVTVPATTPVHIPTGRLQLRGEPAWMPDGQSILVSAAEPGAGYEIFAVRLNLAGARQISHHPGENYDPEPSPDGSKIAWIGRDAKPHTYATAKLYVANADGSRVRILAGSLDRDVTRIQWGSDSRNLYFLAEDSGASHVWAARADGNVRQVTAARDRLLDFSLAGNGRAAALRSTGEIVMFPVDVRGATTKLASPNAALLAARETVAPEEIRYPSAGKNIQGWIVKPPAFDRARKYPLLIDVQDAPRRMCGVEFNLRAQIFAARGFVVLCANARGTPGFGEEFGNLLRTSEPGDRFDDVMRGIDYLIAQGFVDPARVHIVGGVLAAWAIGHTDRFRSAVAVDPIVTVEGDAERSPITFADDFKTPTLVIGTGAGTGAAALHGTLEARHVATSLLTIAEPHRPSERIRRLDAVLDWLAK